MREKNKISLQKGLAGLESRQEKRIAKRAFVNEKFREDHRLNKQAKTAARREVGQAVDSTRVPRPLTPKPSGPILVAGTGVP